jgi:hypothetical protein
MFLSLFIAGVFASGAHDQSFVYLTQLPIPPHTVSPTNTPMAGVPTPMTKAPTTSGPTMTTTTTTTTTVLPLITRTTSGQAYI